MIDLHTHTNFSDGTESYLTVLKKAQEKQLKYLSITDHNTCNSYFEIEKINVKDYFQGHLIPGIELYTSIEDVVIELLGYGIDYHVMNTEIKKLYKTREELNQYNFDKMYRKYSEIGVKLEENIIKSYTPDKYPSIMFHKYITSNPENKKFFSDKRAWESENVFYRNCMTNPSSQLYVPMSDNYPKCSDVIELIKKSGGLVFVPHIYIYGDNSEKVFKELVNHYDIDGFECYYSTFTPEQTTYLVEFCKNNHFYMSGGSDYHGKTKPGIELGIGRGNLTIPEDVILNWKDKVRKIS